MEKRFEKKEEFTLEIKNNLFLEKQDELETLIESKLNENAVDFLKALSSFLKKYNIDVLEYDPCKQHKYLFTKEEMKGKVFVDIAGADASLYSPRLIYPELFFYDESTCNYVEEIIIDFYKDFKCI